ncbi:hypothetical protein MBLNU459_g0461t2 [Dothideomycetes sp. NU459]
MTALEDAQNQNQPGASGEWQIESPMNFDTLDGLMSGSNSNVSSSSDGKTQFDNGKNAISAQHPSQIGFGSLSAQAGVMSTYPTVAWMPTMYADDQIKHMQLAIDRGLEQVQIPAALANSFGRASTSDAFTSPSQQSAKLAGQGLASGIPLGPTRQKTNNHFEEQKRHRELLNDRHKIGDSVTVSSNLFRTLGELGARLNGYPNRPHEQQGENLKVPLWAIMSMHREDDDEKARLYLDFIIQKRDLIRKGVDPNLIFGMKPEIESIMNQDAFLRASDLSKWIARLIRPETNVTTKRDGEGQVQDDGRVQVDEQQQQQQQQISEGDRKSRFTNPSRTNKSVAPQLNWKKAGFQ